MLTEVAPPRHVSDRHVADRVADAAQARRFRRDATAMVERMAAEARAAGVDHPVAAAISRAARVSALCGPEEFAGRIGVPIDRLVEAESGSVRLGELPVELDGVLGELALDLLSLADLAREWEVPGAAQGRLF